MKNKVVERRPPVSNQITDSSSAIEVLSSLINEIDASRTNKETIDDCSGSSYIDSTSGPSSSRRHVTFDNEEDENCSDDDGMLSNFAVHTPVKRANIEQNKEEESSSDEDSDEQIANFNDNDRDRSNILSPITVVRTSPYTAVRSIIAPYVQEKTASTRKIEKKTNSRVRVERRYGENITGGNLLDQLKEKAAAKNKKQLKKNDKK